MTDEYDYKLTPLALQDIDETLAYISGRLSNGKAAKDLLDEIEHTLAAICAYPYAFADCSAFLIADSLIRHAAVGHYLLIYGIDEEKKQIDVLRFRYAGTDVPNTPLYPGKGK